MKSSLHLLISGDATFTEDLKSDLSSINPEYIIDTAGSGKETLSAASKQKYNAIISLFSLPDMKGTGLFKELVKERTESSLILIFNKGEEEAVLENLDPGAAIYFQKSKKLNSLAKELEEKIQKIIHENTRTTKSRDDIYSKACFRENPNGILIFDKEGRFKTVNLTACRMTGYSEEEYLQMSISDMHALAPESEKGEIRKFQQLLKTGHMESEMLFKRKNGSNIFMEINAVRISPDEYISFISDITEKKEFLEALKESEDRYRSLFNGVPDYILVHKDGNILYVNPAVSEILGTPVDDVIGHHIMDFVAPEAKEKVLLNMKKRLEGEHIPSYEIVINTKIGPRMTEVHGSMIRYRGETASLVVLTDITYRKEAEEALQRSREQYKNLVENISDIIYNVDSDGIITYISPVIESHLGIPPEEITGKPFSEFIFSDDLKEVEKGFKDTLKGKMYPQTFRAYDSEGRLHYLRSSSRPVEIEEHFSGFTGTLSDFTAEMIAKNELLESEMRFRSLFENTIFAYHSLDSRGCLLEINDEWSKLTGYSEKEAIGTPFADYLSKDMTDGYISLFSEFMKTGELKTEISILTKDKKTVTALISGKIQRDAGGNFVRAHFVLNDITARKHAEEYSRLLANMSDSAPASIIVHDFKGNLIYANEETLRLHGYSRNEFMKMKLHRINVPESRALLDERMREIRDKKELDYDVEHYRKDRSSFPLHVNVKIVEWEGKEVLLNIATDITERKEAEKLLKEKNLFLQQMLDTIPNPIFYKDKNEIYLGCNRAFEEIIGHTKDEIVGKTIFELAPKNFAEIYHKMDAKLLKNPGVQNYETEAEYADGSIHDVIFYKATYNDINGKTAGIVGLLLDITERKQFEKALKESEEKFRSYMDYAKEGIIIADPSGRYIEANSAACELLGYTKDELLKLSVLDLLLPEDKEAHLANFMEIKNKKHLVSEMEVLRKDRTAVHVIISAVLLPNGNILGLHTNISDMKRAEDAFKEANRKLNLLSSITRHDILNQLTGIIAFLEIIEMDGTIPSGSKTEEYLKKISGAAQTIKRQILFTKDYKDLGEQAPKWQKAGVIVDEVAETPTFSDLKVENKLGELEIYADPLLEKVVYNLFDNAVKHGEKITKISFEFEDSAEGATLVCEDDGMGIPEEFKEKIFKREHYKNTGLGLFLSREILSITGLSMKETGVYGKGARFEIKMPSGTFRFE